MNHCPRGAPGRRPGVVRQLGATRRPGVVRLIGALAATGLTLAVSAGCHSAPAAGARPAATHAPESGTLPAGTDPTGTGPDGTGPAGSGSPGIGVASPAAGTAAGAQLGPAARISPTRIAALPAPTGPGAVARGSTPAMVFHGPRDRKRIALTFDSNMTDAMLRRLDAGTVRSYANSKVVDQLQRLRVPATFFLAGKWIQAYPDLTRRIAADPAFELASHSWAHDGFTSPCYSLGHIARDAMAADVERSFEILAQFTPHPTRYFRFPGGCFDAAAMRAIAATGCTSVEYDDVSGDAFGTSAKAIAAATVRQARPGSIVVLHITEANAPLTGNALPTIVAQLRSRGFELVTLSDLLS